MTTQPTPDEVTTLDEPRRFALPVLLLPNAAAEAARVSDEAPKPELSEAERLLRDFDESIDPDIVVPLLRRPRSRAECVEGIRPCPWVSCRYHLYLDVSERGGIKFNFPDREPEEMMTTCALDVALSGPQTLEAIAGYMGFTKERSRQLETVGLLKMKSTLGVDDGGVALVTDTDGGNEASTADEDTPVNEDIMP